MRIRTLALLTSFAAFACGGDDDDSTTNNTTATDTDVTTTMSTTDATATLTTTDGTESSSSAGETLTTTENPESSGPGESSDSGSSGSADSGSSDSGGPSAECQTYCDLFQTNCDGGVGGSMSYDSDDACLTACAGFSEAGLMCRTGHLDGSATGMDPSMVDGYYDTHCPHGDSSGGGVCMD